MRIFAVIIFMLTPIVAVVISVAAPMLVAAAIVYIAKFNFKWRLAKTVKKRYIDHLDSLKKEIVEVEFKGYKLPMTRYEKLTIWDNLTTEGKKKALSDWKQHLKQ